MLSFLSGCRTARCKHCSPAFTLLCCQTDMALPNNFSTNKQMVTLDQNSRHLPCYILHNHNIPCVVWVEDAVRFYGVPTVGFDLYILVPDIEVASQVLIQEGWNLVQQEKGKIGNATVDYPQCRLTPPSQADHEAKQLPEPHISTSQLPLPPPDKSPAKPTTTVLLPAADWNSGFVGTV